MEADAGIRSSWLIDDLRSELSRGFSETLLALVRQQECQVVVTALEVPSGDVGAEVGTLFHVEHDGTLTRR